jgi:hypothetical protein
VLREHDRAAQRLGIPQTRAVLFNVILEPANAAGAHIALLNLLDFAAHDRPRAGALDGGLRGIGCIDPDPFGEIGFAAQQRERVGVICRAAAGEADAHVRERAPRTSTMIFFERSPVATAVVTSAMLRTCEVRLPAMPLTDSVRSRHVPATPSTRA